MIRFLAIFFLVYGSAHLYAFLRLRALFPGGRRVSVALALFMIFMVTAPILVRIGEKAGFETSVRLLAWGCYLWMGLLFIFVSAAAVLDGWRLLVYLAQLLARCDLHHLLPPAGRAARVLLALSAVLSIYAVFEALWVRAEHITVETDRIAPGTGPVTIVQISDVHVGLIVREWRLRRILQVVRDAEPDLLVSTGDLVDGQINDIDLLADLFGEIQPKYGKFAVTGNHEYYAGLEHALSFTRRAGFTVLRDQRVAPGGIFDVVGIDDRGRNTAQAAIDETGLIGTLPRERFTLLLKHRPLVDEISCGLVDLQLSGHTHRGQIFPFGLVTKLFFAVNSGTVRFPGGCLLHVSRGSGTWGPPMRLLSPPEVTVIRLVGRR